MPEKTIHFEIVTPEKVVLRKDVIQATIPTQIGEITILPNHIPLVSILKSGVVVVTGADNVVDVMSVSGGFVEVMEGKVVILADSAEKAEELDEEKIKQARERAEESKKQAESADEVKFTEATVQLEKELARLRAVNRWRKLKGLDQKN